MLTIRPRAVPDKSILKRLCLYANERNTVMYKRLSVLPLVIGIFFVLFFACDFAFGRGPGLSSRIGSPIMPSTSNGSGLHKSRSERHIYERNLAVTGNVSGGKHFRGAIPYRSTSAFRGALGSTSINSFIRRSSGSPTGYTKPGQLEPYFQPSRTVSSIKRNGLSGLRRPKTPFAGGTGDFKLPPVGDKLSDMQIDRLNYQGIQGADLGVYERPMALPPQTEALFRKVDRLARRQKMVDEDSLLESDIYLRLEKSLSQEVKSDVNLSEDKLREKKFMDDLITDTVDIPESEKIMKPLTAEDIRTKLAELREKEKLEAKEIQESNGLPDDTNDTNAVEKKNGPNSDGGKADVNDVNDRNSNTGSVVEGFGIVAPPDPLAGIDINKININSKKSKELIKQYKNFEGDAELKFQTYIKIADKFLADGQYYSAKDAYEIAGVWKNNDPRAYIGKAYAHLAAGEYMSSSKLIVWALEASGEYAGKKDDIGAIIGNKDLYIRRRSEVRTMFDAGGFYKTAFLLAYLSCQDGDFVKAKECIDSAASQLSYSNSWKALKKAIEDGLAKQKK
jgi:tetratricopeptide (TPR) repeat protein